MTTKQFCQNSTLDFSRLKLIVMLICNVFTDKDGKFSKLIIQPEVTDGGEEIEIQLTKEQAAEISALEDLSNDRE